MTRCCFVWFAIFDVGFVMRGFANWDRGLRISDFAICDLRFAILIASFAISREKGTDQKETN